MRVLIIALMLTGCATTSTSSFKAEKASDALINTMANDAAVQIKRIYPADKTKLIVMDGNKYGVALSGALRKSGFAIAEKEGNNINYFVDNLEGNVYRASLGIGKTKLSRGYVDGVKPYFISDWTVGVEYGR
jgi:uncharacterized lipoprotein YajG